MNALQNESTIYAFIMCISNSNTESSALSEKIKNYEEMFFNKNAGKLSSHKMQNHVIKLNDNNSSYKSFYNLSALELKTLQEYLNNALMKKWIKHFINSAKASIFFVLKKNRDLYLCIDYCAFNKIIIKNRHALSLINEILNCMIKAQKFLKIDLKDVYHCLHIKEDHEWKMTFHTWYSHFKYMIMLFELSNASATFQAYINKTLTDLINVIYVIYLDDILIYNEKSEKH